MDGWPAATAVKLGVVEVLDRDGHVRASIPVWRWPVTIGRAVDCDVVLDDVHAAGLHATVEDIDGALHVRVGDSVNGLRVARRHVAAGECVELPAGEVFQAGHTRLRIRRATDPLPPERRLAPDTAAGLIPTPLLVWAFISWNVCEFWLDADPGGRMTDYVPIVFGPPLVLAAWSGLWSIGSRLFRHRFDFWPHLRVALGYSLVIYVVALVFPIAAFALGWPFLSRVSGIAATGIAWAMVLAHMTLMLPVRRRVLTGVMSALFVAGLSLYLIRSYQVQDRVFDELYVTALPPPAFRLAPAVSTGQFIAEARALQGVLDHHVEDSKDE